MRGSFFRRVGIFIAIFSLLAVIGGCALFWLIASALGWVNFADRGDFFPAFWRGWPWIGLIIGVIVFALIARALRRAAVPVGDLIEAASRVEAGDYSVRVRERGPREVRALARSFNAMVARLEANEAMRRNLLADVTHELRTPLTVVQGNLEGLMDGLYPRDDAHLAPILEETHVLSRLIDDLRTLALAESGNLKLQREPTDLSALANDAVASLRAQVDEAGVAIEVAAPADLPMMEIDPVRIREVLVNVLNNALRYTPRGGSIAIVISKDDARRQVNVAVRDTGAGISPDVLPHIFDRFTKSRDSLGSGLGLAIAKQLVTAHGGEMWAESEIGKGTTIRFTLPVAVLI